MSSVDGNLQSLHAELTRFRPNFELDYYDRPIWRALSQSETKFIPGVDLTGDKVFAEIAGSSVFQSIADKARKAGRELAEYSLSRSDELLKSGLAIPAKPSIESDDLFAYAASLVRMVYECVALAIDAKFNISSVRDSEAVEKEARQYIGSGGTEDWAEHVIRRLTVQQEASYFRALATHIETKVLIPMFEDFKKLIESKMDDTDGVRTKLLRQIGIGLRDSVHEGVDGQAAMDEFAPPTLESTSGRFAKLLTEIGIESMPVLDIT